MTEASSPVTPYRPYPSSITMALDVFFADSTSVFSSSGQVVRGSITSALMPSFSSKRRSAQRHLYHAAGRHQSNIFAHALDVRDTQGNGVIFRGHWSFLAIHHFVFEKDDRIVVANRSFQQALGIIRCGRQNHFQPGHMAEPGVQAIVNAARPIGGSLPRSSAAPSALSICRRTYSELWRPDSPSGPS